MIITGKHPLRKREMYVKSSAPVKCEVKKRTGMQLRTRGGGVAGGLGVKSSRRTRGGG